MKAQTDDSRRGAVRGGTEFELTRSALEGLTRVWSRHIALMLSAPRRLRLPGPSVEALRRYNAVGRRDRMARRRCPPTFSPLTLAAHAG